jgi:hypothetical protein
MVARFKPVRIDLTESGIKLIAAYLQDRMGMSQEESEVAALNYLDERGPFFIEMQIEAEKRK